MALSKGSLGKISEIASLNMAATDALLLIVLIFGQS